MSHQSPADTLSFVFTFFITILLLY
jgi:hypothetical protein